MLFSRAGTLLGHLNDVFSETRQHGAGCLLKGPGQQCSQGQEIPVAEWGALIPGGFQNTFTDLMVTAWASV